LINCAAKVNAGKIALAHNLDDNAETVISRFISGSGTTGMSGIPPVREIQPGEFNTVVLFKNGAQPVIIRPLIGETKKQILSYDKANSVKYVIDATNRSNIYTRNSIRNRLIPFIEKNYSPNFKEAAVQSAEIASVENEFMRSEAKKQLRHTVKQISDKRCVVDVGKYLRLHKALRCRVLRMILENITGHKRKITYSLVSDVDKAVIAGKKMDLPYGFCIKSGVFEKKAVLKKNIDRGRAEISSLKDLPQQVEYNGKLFKFSSCAKTAGLMLKTGNTVYMDLDRVSFPIYIRQRKQGDRFIPFGMQKQVKLKDFIISQKIKETLTVVSDRSHIIWAAGHRIDDSVKVNEDSKKLLRIEINSI
jgi:tRNA(Ile)-lysidine synthase